MSPLNRIGDPKPYKMAAMVKLVYQTNSVGVKPFSYVKTLLSSNKFAYQLATRGVKTLFIIITKNIRKLR